MLKPRALQAVVSPPVRVRTQTALVDPGLARHVLAAQPLPKAQAEPAAVLPRAPVLASATRVWRWEPATEVEP
ncbi:MAG: hypothetical protein EXQ55_02430 [Acidobacteria bacterium]|nr:hypothetical protein [Acidobacteriota bacterium]